jgi:FtsH-binding integral membrane protein
MSVSSYYTPSVSQADAPTRSKFIRQTYIHLVLAILAFAGISALFMMTGISAAFTSLALSTNYSWFIVIGAFIIVSAVANNWARSSTSLVTQYLGLFVYVILEALIFAPLLFFAANFAGSQLIGLAGFLTLFLTAALTFITFLNRTDFSFLRSFLVFGGFLALGIIIAASVFGISLGLWFSGAMVLFAGASILYDTSKIMLHYNTTQYVAASLSLFASVALLFYYILTFLLNLTRD